MTQPAYLAIAAALRSSDVLDVAELSAMRIASAVAHLAGGALPGDSDTPDDATKAARLELAAKLLGGKIDRRVIASAILQIAECGDAVAADQSNPAASLAEVDMSEAWRRNFSDFALLVSVM